MTQAYPLSWPMGWNRTPAHSRQRAKFGKKETVYGQHGGGWSQSKELTIPDALKRLIGEIDRLGARDLVVSSNVELRTDGFPRSVQKVFADPGVAVYFKLKGKDRVLACDKWDRVADNIAAIAAHIDAIRRQDRYGVGTLDQAFAGYAALPAPNAEEPWHVVLGVMPTAPINVIDAAYKSLAKLHHPDTAGANGSAERMAKINAAYTQAKKERDTA